MAREKIDSIYDIAALEKEQMQVLSFIKETADVIAKMPANGGKTQSLLGDAKTVKEVTAAVKEAESAMSSLKDTTGKLSDEEKALERVRKQLIRAQVQQTEAGQKLKTQISAEQAALQELNANLKQTAREERSATDYTKAMSREFDTATMNVAEMSAELARLNRMSFKGLNPAQIEEVKMKMAALKEEIGDFNKRIAASGDKTMVMIGGLQGIVAVAQGVTSTLAVMGIENKNLERTMIALISASQALATIHELREKGLIKENIAILKNTFQKAQNTIATWANAKANDAATKAGSGFFKMLAANPTAVIVAGFIAVGLAIWGLVEAFSASKSEADKLYDSQKQVFDDMASTVGTARRLGDVINTAAAGTLEFNNAIVEYNKVATEQNLLMLDEHATLSDLNTVMAINNKLLEGRGKIKAANNQIDVYYAELMKSEVAIEKIRAEVGDTQLSRQLIANIESERASIQKNIKDLQTYVGTVQDEIATTEAIIRLKAENQKKRDEIAKMTAKETTATQANTTAINKEAEALEKLNDLLAVDVQDPLVNRNLAGQIDVELFRKQAWEKAKANEDANKKMLADDDVFKKKIEGFYSESIMSFDWSLKMKREKLEEYYAQGLILEEDYNKAIEELEKQRVENFTNIIDKSMELVGAFADYQNAKGDAELQRLEQQHEAGLISDEEFNRRRTEIEREQAIRSRNLAAFQVGIDTSKAIMSIWGDASLPTLMKLIFSGIAAATGAVQLAAINAAPLPAYATGRDGGAAEWAITGEQGRELVDTGNGMFLTPATPTLTWLPEGSSVLTAPETAALMRGGYYTSDTSDGNAERLERIERAITNKELLNINITEKGLGMSAVKASQYFYYINRNVRR